MLIRADVDVSNQNERLLFAICDPGATGATKLSWKFLPE